jgi:hypothetical protein
MIRISDILQEVLLGEKRAVAGVMNPNENLGALLDKLYKDYGYDKVYVSFRDSKHVGKINPNNQYGTPTGLYTYKLSNYITTPVDNLEEFRRKFPFASDRKFAQFLVVNDNIVQLNSSTSKGVLDGYVKKIMSMYPNIDPIQGLCKNWLDGSYQSYYSESKNDTHRFWLFLYDVVSYSKDRSSQSKVNMFSSLCRKLGIDSFDDDKCEGWIHPNEKCQTVFLRSNLFKDEYVFDLGAISSKSTAVDMKGSSEDKLKWLLGLSRDKLIELISRNVLGDLIIELYSHIDVIMDKLDGDILKYMISNMTYSGINRLLSNSKNIGQLSELVLNAKGKNLENQTIPRLLFLNDYNFELTKRILDLKGDNITNDNITVILDDNPYAFKVSELLIDILGPKLKGDGIYSILMHSKGLVSSNEFNGLIKKLIIKTKETLNNNGIVQILYHSKDPYELIDLLNEIYEGDVVSEALNQMNYSYYLESMIHNKSNPDRFITYLIKTVPNKLDTSELKILFDNTKDSQKLITELLSTKEFIKSVVDSDNIFVVIDLMNRSDNPNLVKSAFGSFGDEVISRFNASGYLSMLFRKCNNCGELVDILLSSEQFLSNMASDDDFMREALPYLMKASGKDETIYKLLSLNGVIEGLTPMLVSDILSYSSKPYELFKLILSKGYTFDEYIAKKKWYADFTYFTLDRLSKVDSKNVDNMIKTLMSIDKVRENVGINDLYYMLSHSNNPELVKSLFGDRFSEFVKNLSDSRVFIMLAKSPDPEKLVDVYNGVIDIKYALENAGISDIENMLYDPTNKPAVKRILDRYGIDYSKNESVKSMLRDKLISESFDFGSMTDEEQGRVFDVFKKSYEASTGVSWDINKFKSRASNWVFFGDESGYVAVRPQASGLYKLVGVAGNPKGILSGLNELLSTGRPIWGMVSKDIQGMAIKKGFKTPPAMVMRVLLKFIPKSVFGGTDFELNSDGSVTMKYSDVGDAKKYFIGNEAYFKKLKSDILPTMKDKLSELPMVVRKGIDMFLGEGELKESDVLSEDITSGRVIVYHRTGKGGESPVANIAADGYRVGSGAMYGVGVYTTYTLDSQLSGKMSGYGSIIIESKVLSMDKFLIFDYNVAKKIYGNKNYTLDKQLRLILGGEWRKYKNNNKLKDLISKIGMTKYTSDVATKFYDEFKDDIVPKLRGMVFTGSNDGNVLVSYDRTNVEPLRYTTDEGVSWINIVDKNIYKRMKGYNPDDSNTEHQHILNKLQLDTPLTDKEIEFIKGDPSLFDKYKSALRDKLNRYLNASSPWGRRKSRLRYSELLVLGSAEISAYINAMDWYLIRFFLRDEGIEKLAFLKEYGGDNKSVKSISASYEAFNNADEDALNDLLPSGIKVDISRDTITLEHLNDDDIDPNTIQLLNRLADDVWDGGYYDDYYDGRDDSLNDDYLHYIGEAINNDVEFAEAMSFYGLGKTAKEIGNSFDDYDLKDDIIDTIKEVMNEASEEAKQASWREIYDTASDIINLDCGYRNRGSDCDLRLNLNSFILSGGYMLFELEDPIEDFYGSLDSVLESYLELYADKIPTSTDDIWDQVNDNNMTPNHNKITDMIIEKGDEMIEKINDEEDEGDNDVEELSPIELVIEKFKDTLRGLKQSEQSDYIENKLVKIQFDKRRLRRDNSIYVKMLDKTNNKTTEGYMKIDDIPVYFTNYKLAMGESVRASLRKALLG